MIDDQLFDKIAKLRILATHDNTPQAEAEAATAAIHRLLLTHNLDMLEVERRINNTQPKSRVVDHTYTMESNALWRIDLMTAMASNNYCRALSHRRRGSQNVVYLVGHQTNIEAVLELYNTYSNIIERHALACYVPPTENTHAYRTMFRKGMVDGINARLKREKQEVINNNPTSSALVPVIEKEVSNYVKHKWPRLNKDYRQDRWGAGYKNGYSTGLNTHARKELS